MADTSYSKLAIASGQSAHADGPARRDYSRVCDIVRTLRARCCYILQKGPRKNRFCDAQGPCRLRLYGVASVKVWLCLRHKYAIEKQYGKTLKIQQIER